VEDYLFSIAQTVLGVKNGRSAERAESLGGVLLKILLGEDVINLEVEIDVVGEVSHVGDSKVVLKSVVLRDGECNFLDVENVSEFLAGYISLSENIVILEELKKSDAIFFALVLDLGHESVVGCVCTAEIGPFLNISGFGFGGGSINNVLKAVSVSQEVGVTDFTVGFSVFGSNEADIISRDVVVEEGKNLSELLLGDLEMLVAIPVLEEGLGIESLLTDDFCETVENALDSTELISSDTGASVESHGTGVIEVGVNALFESLLSEDLVNTVAEVSPADVLTSLGGFE